MIGILMGVEVNMAWAEAMFAQSDVFARGQDGVNIYRIPGVIVSPSGTVLAFCEAREAGDQSPTDMVLKRSFDNGATWDKMQTVVKRRGPQAIMNPCPVIDRKDGSILLFCNLFPDAKSQEIPGAVRQLVLRSTDDGATWSKPVDISAQLGDPKTWASLCSGPGVAIQTSNGRIVVPLWHYEGGGERDYLTGVFFSDDHGKTWRAGKAIAGGGDEGQVVELADGTLMLNWRSARTAATRGRSRERTTR
jgi:sialidase-1